MFGRSALLVESLEGVSVAACCESHVLSALNHVGVSDLVGACCSEFKPQYKGVHCSVSDLPISWLEPTPLPGIATNIQTQKSSTLDCQKASTSQFHRVLHTVSNH